MTRLLTFEIFVPLGSLLREATEILQQYQEGLHELSNLKSFSFKLESVGEIVCQISYTKDYISLSDKYARNLEALIFTIKIPSQKSESIEYSKKGKRITNTVNNFILYTVSEFQIQVSNFLLFLQIAKPLAFKTRKGDVFVNKKLFEAFDEITSIHQESFEDIKRLKWPIYKSLQFELVLNWAKKYHLSFENMAKTKLEIALNTYSYLFQFNTSYTLDLLWSLIGIESLYCSSKEGIAEQIFERTQILLGPITDFKKRLKSMYNFRSRFIHGDLMIPSSISESFATQEVENFTTDFYQETFFAVAILTATLQKIVELDKNEIEFRTVIA